MTVAFSPAALTLEALLARGEPSLFERDPVVWRERLVDWFQVETGRVLYPDQTEMYLIEMAAYALALHGEAAQAAVLSNVAVWASGGRLDDIAANVGIFRLEPAAARATVRFTLASPRAVATTIPAGTVVAAGEVRFTTDTNLTILAGSTTGDVGVTATEAGSKHNGFAPGQIDSIVTALGIDGLSVGSTTATSGGAEAETDEALRRVVVDAPEAFDRRGGWGGYGLAARRVPGVVDVAIHRPQPGYIDVYPLTEGDDPPGPNDWLGLFHVYVDSSGGSDSNDGLSAETPLATLAAAATTAAAIGTGARIGLCAGSEWRATLDLSALDGVTVAAYGQTDLYGLPTIDGADVISGPWDDSTARGDSNTEVYSIDVTMDDLLPGDNYFPLAWEDGQRLHGVDTLAECQAEAGTFYVSGLTDGRTTASTYTLHIHPRGSTDPNSDGKTYEAVTRSAGLIVGDGATVRQIHARRVGTNAGAIIGGWDVLFDRCLGEECARHVILAKSGEMRDCIGWNQTTDRRAGLGEILLEFYAASFNGQTDVTGRWTRCVAVIDAPLAGVDIAAGFGGHTSTPGDDYALFEMEDCAVVRCSMAGGVDTDEVRMIRPRIVDGQIAPSGITTATVTDPWIVHTGAGVDLGQGVIVQGAPTDMTVTGARAYVTGALPGTALVRKLSTSTGTLTVDRSVLVAADGVPATQWMLRLESDGTTVTDTVIVYEGGDFDMRFLDTNEAAPFSGNGGNVYWPGNFDVGGTYAGTAADAAAQAALDTGSVVADPMVSDAAAGNWALGGSGLPAGVGLKRPNVSYIVPPVTIEEAETQLRFGAAGSDVKVALLDAVAAALPPDTMRPQGDFVTVKAPTPTDFTVALTIRVDPAVSADTVQAEAEAAVAAAFARFRRPLLAGDDDIQFAPETGRLGAQVAPGMLVAAAAAVPGVIDASVSGVAYTDLPFSQYPRLAGITTTVEAGDDV